METERNNALTGARSSRLRKLKKGKLIICRGRHPHALISRPNTGDNFKAQKEKLAGRQQAQSLQKLIETMWPTYHHDQS